MGVAEARFYRDLAPEIPVRIPGVWFADTDGDGYVDGARRPRRQRAAASRTRRTTTSPVVRATSSSSWRRCTHGSGSRRASTTAATSRGSRRRARAPRAAARRSCRWPSTTLGDRHARRVPSPRRHLPRPQRRHRALVELRAAHVRARRSAHGQSVRRHRGRRPHRLPRLGGDRPVAGPARRRVRVVQLDPGRGPRRRRARAPRSLLRTARPKRASTSTRETAWEQYRLFAVYSWVSAASTAGMGSKWQPLHIGLGGTNRATAACEQLGCVELLEQLLG